MLGRTVGLIAALALGANAFLLPPGVADVDGKPDLSGFAIDTETSSILLPCPECVTRSETEETAAEAKEGDDLVWIQGGANNVLLDFTVKGHALTLGGFTLYPEPEHRDERPVVNQVAASASLASIKSSTETVKTTPLAIDGRALTILEEVASEEGDVLVRLIYQILTLDGHPVSLDGAKVTMLKNKDGELMILSVEAVPAEFSPPGRAHHRPGHGHRMRPELECGMLPAFLCKWKHSIGSMFHGPKPGMHHKAGGCAGRKGGHRRPGHLKPHFEMPGKPHSEEAGKPDMEEAGKPHLEVPGKDGRPHRHHGPPSSDGKRPDHPHHGPPHPGHGPRPHGPPGPHGPPPHHHGHHHGHFLHRVLKSFLTVLVPIMAGITMGLVASVLGMLAGRVIGFLWIKFRRGGKRGYASVAQTEEFVVTEKGAAIEEADVDVENLPAYEAAPAYEATEEK